MNYRKDFVSFPLRWKNGIIVVDIFPSLLSFFFFSSFCLAYTYLGQELHKEIYTTGMQHAFCVFGIVKRTLEILNLQYTFL